MVWLNPLLEFGDKRCWYEIKGVCGLMTQWKRQCNSLWTEKYWYDSGRGMHLKEWKVDLISTKKSELQESSHVLWRKVKGRVLYTNGQKISCHQGGGKNK